MIPVAPVPEPAGFDEGARKPGQHWLLENPNAERLRDLWSPFRGALAAGFSKRCGYTAMLELAGTVDHFESVKQRPDLAYEWSNYRFAAQWINSAKRTKIVLDPYLVGEGWFEILLPSLQLVLTDAVSAEHRALAEQTLANLPIGHDERIIKQRREWYDMYREGHLALSGLWKVAPLIAAAVEKAQRAPSDAQ